MFYAVFSRVTKDKWFVRFVVTASWKKRNSFSCSTSSSFFEKAHEDPGFVCCDNYHTPFEKSKTINAISPSTVCIVYYPIMTRVKIFVQCHFTLSNDAFAISFQFGYLALFTKVFPLEQISRKVKGTAGMNKKVECEEVLFLFEAQQQE